MLSKLIIHLIVGLIISVAIGVFTTRVTGVSFLIGWVLFGLVTYFRAQGK